MVDHLEYIHIYGFDGGEEECFQGLNSGSLTVTGSGGEEPTSSIPTAVNLDLTPLIEALAGLTPQPVDLMPLVEALAGLTPQPVDLTPLIEALAPLSHLERITELDLTALIDKLSEISNKMVVYNLSGITQALEELRDRVADLAFVDAKIDFGFFKIWLLNRIAEM